MKEQLAAQLKDKNGHIAVWQWPNPPLYAWMIFGVASHISSGRLQTGSAALSQASLVIWAYLEFTQGASHFRRALGLTVLAMFIYTSFAH